jgi:hypothetical protein
MKRAPKSRHFRNAKIRLKPSDAAPCTENRSNFVGERGYFAIAD